ncbi:uncharacterized protein LOC118433785 [Folsomia candida]|nr:uncharacterized protein LOC118433785 [Folsomia candida]
MDDILFYEEPMTLLVANSQNAQHVGYMNDLLNNGANHLSPPPPQVEEAPSISILEKCRSYDTLNIRGCFGVTTMYSEVAHRRLIDIINQCRYIASKKGMDKRQLIESIKQDEIQGTTWLTDFQNTPWHHHGQEINNMSRDISQVSTNIIGHGEKGWDPSSHHLTCDKVNATSDRAMKHALHNVIRHPRIPKFIGNTYTRESTSRPLITDDQQPSCTQPERLSTSASPTLPKGEDESLMDEIKLKVFEDSDEESDFDPSVCEGSKTDLLKTINFENINHKYIGCNEDENELSNGIKPIRKPAAHNLFNFYEDGKKSNTQIDAGCNIVSSCNSKNSKNQPSKDPLLCCANKNQEIFQSDQEYSDTRDLILQTARAKACASYIQLRHKMSQDRALNTTKEPLTGSLNEFDDLLLTDFQTSDETEQNIN